MTQTVQTQVGTYKQNYGSNGSRETDMRALLKFASQLQDALTGNGQDMKAYQDAIRQNQRLWTIFQIALSDPENKLPVDLKTQLLNVSRRVDKVSFAAIARFDVSALTELINLNRTIAKGLAKAPPDAPSSQPGAPIAAQESAAASVQRVAIST